MLFILKTLARVLADPWIESPVIRSLQKSPRPRPSKRQREQLFCHQKLYTMLETMYVRCTHCGYDNSPEYRFCGMCGASLAHPPAVEPATAKEAPRPPKSGNGHTENVHGPSFLGLAEDPKVEFHYLYEDDQPKSHVG